MLILRQLKLPVDHDDSAVLAAALRLLSTKEVAVAEGDLQDFKILRRAIDARKGRVALLYHVTFSLREGLAAEEALVERVSMRLGRGGAQVMPYRASLYPWSSLGKESEEKGRGSMDRPSTGSGALGGQLPRPVIIGTGPCGLFAGLLLARAGLCPILLEKGKAAGPRARDVTGFWRRGVAFDEDSNVQFGEGGAGTFSDGKLYTQIKDPGQRIPWILEEMVKAGGPKDILVKARPHVGTDRLIKVVQTIRREIESFGGEVRFGAEVKELLLEDGQARGVKLEGGEELLSAVVVLAVGHSARKMFFELHRAGVKLEAKPFSMGARVEHPQTFLDRTQYGKHAGHERLGSAPYKFVSHLGEVLGSKRSAYSFCMCPGGLVVAAASEEGRVVTNGMSSYARAEANANSGFMVEVTEGDVAAWEWARGDVLDGVRFQRHWEEKAFELGGGGFVAPAQKLGDLMKGKASAGEGEVKPSYEPGVRWTSLQGCLPDFVWEGLRRAVPRVEKRLPGFAMKDAVLTGVETRSSSPVRVERERESLEAVGISGLYPAGEGAGYAGGIISAAVDGMKVAEKILEKAGIEGA